MQKKVVPSLFAAVGISAVIAVDENAAPATKIKVHATPVPVDDSMHHLMEYVFEPAYLRLKELMKEEPKEKSGWSAIKGDSLTLAEASNLLLHRLPDKDADEWIKLAVATRTVGGEFYEAARKRNYTSAKDKYGLMLKSCNACHDKFAEGEHQLEY